jgi:hypothetical protein
MDPDAADATATPPSDPDAHAHAARILSLTAASCPACRDGGLTPVTHCATAAHVRAVQEAAARTVLEVLGSAEAEDAAARQFEQQRRQQWVA